MNKIKLVFILIFSVSVCNLYAQNLDFAFNIGNFGWGMNIPKDTKNGDMTFNFLNLYVEHKKSNIGIEISPVNIWADYSCPNYLTSFFNIRLYYNFIDKIIYNLIDYDIDWHRKGSNYFLIGPFVSLNYLSLGNNYSFDPNNIQINIGFKGLGMIDYTVLWGEIFAPFGFQFLNLELGYRYNNYKLNNHQFYFNLSTDILVLGYIIGLFIFNHGKND